MTIYIFAEEGSLLLSKIFLETIPIIIPTVNSQRIFHYIIYYDQKLYIASQNMLASRRT
jgi:hypothetical protein